MIISGLRGDTVATDRIARMMHGQIEDGHGNGLGLVEAETETKTHGKPEFSVPRVAVKGAHSLAGGDPDNANLDLFAGKGMDKLISTIPRRRSPMVG